MKIGFLGLLTLLFVAAKLFGYITWSWLMVFSPIWIFTLVLIVLGLLIGAIKVFAENS